MKKAAGALSFAALLLLMWLSVRAAGVLPMPKSELIADKYDSWTGVLRLWVYEGWQSGNNSLTAWLNFSVGNFEKVHPGVYVQAKAVDAQAIRELGASGVNPPDLILFPPGLLDNAEHLSVLSPDVPLRSGLAEAGTCGGQTFALPVAMGAYAWAYDRAQIEEIPASWAEEEYLLSAPADGEYRSWAGALLALCSGLSAETETEIPLPGVELGLPEAESTPAPTPSAAPESGIPCALPENFTRDSNTYSAFTAGGIAAMPVTQREIRRLELLSESGKGPDWAVAMPGSYAFADQLALMAVIDWPRDDIAERKALGEELIAHLLSAESQAALSKSRAFPVRADAAAYGDRSAMAQLEAALAEKTLIAPNAFGDGWRSRIAALLEAHLSGRISARGALESFFADF